MATQTEMRQSGSARQRRKSGVALLLTAILTAPILVISETKSWHAAIDRWIFHQLDIFHIMHPLYSPTVWLVIALSAPVVLVIALPIHRLAIRNINHPTKETLITLASLSAFGWSIYANITGSGSAHAEVAATIILAYNIGRFFESLAKHCAGRALEILLALEGKREVSVIRNGETVLITIGHLVVGDQFIAEPGESIATDGVVLSGESAVDVSLLTGESQSIEVRSGSAVIGSSLNRTGHLLVRATRVGSNTELARITAMVASAQGAKTPIQRKADRICAVFVPIVVAIAIGTFLSWHLTHHSLSRSISAAIAVLVIASPGALGLAAPLAFLMAAGRGALRGIVIRQPRILEVTRKINQVVLDKSGTITGSRMLLLHAVVVPIAGEVLGASFKDLLNESTILSSALSIESKSDHSAAVAISNYVLAMGIKPTSVTDFSATRGTGAAGRVHIGALSPVVLIGSPIAVAHSSTPFHPDLTRAVTEAQKDGLTVAVLAWDGVALAVFAVGDEIKPDAAKTIEKLKRRGIDPWLITGDGIDIAQAVSTEVGIVHDHVIASALPQQKVELVKALQKHDYRVLMIGDGITDAAALAAADLSIAMRTGNDTAITAADIILLRPQLGSVTDALDLSMKTVRVIRMNLAWAFAYNIIGLPIAALGVLSPIYAAAAMAVSSLLVVTNSLRIK
jgi:Cu+-exporting ATPase